MTDKEIIENNRLIAEFMGAKHKKDMPSLSQSYMEGNNYLWIPIHGIVRNDTISTGKGSIVKYHSSWDWLMPVVERISEVSSQNDTIKLNTLEIFKHSSIFSPIKAIYYDCIDFIKWYNENKEV